MRKYTATICLTIAVLLGSLAEAKPPNPLYWAGHKAEIEGGDGWVIVIEYSADGRQYLAELEFVPGQRTCTIKGSVSDRGVLEETFCQMRLNSREVTGSVGKINLEDLGYWGGADFEDQKIEGLRTRYLAAKSRYDQACSRPSAKRRCLAEERRAPMSE